MMLFEIEKKPGTIKVLEIKVIPLRATASNFVSQLQFVIVWHC
jgi:hypothetical protein